MPRSVRMKWWMPIVGTFALATAAATAVRLGQAQVPSGSENSPGAPGGTTGGGGGGSETAGGATGGIRAGGTATGGAGAGATAGGEDTGGPEASEPQTWQQLQTLLDGAIAQRAGMARLLEASGADANKKKCILDALKGVKAPTTQLYALKEQVAAGATSSDASAFRSLVAQGVAVARDVGAGYAKAVACKSKDDDGALGLTVTPSSNIPTNAGNAPTGNVFVPADVFVPGDERYISASPEVGPAGTTGGTTGTRIADIP